MSHDLYPRHDSAHAPAPRKGQVRFRPAALLSWLDAWRERRRHRRVRAAIERLQEARRQLDESVRQQRCKACGELLPFGGVGTCSERCRLDAEIMELEAQLAIETTKGETT